MSQSLSRALIILGELGEVRSRWSSWRPSSTCTSRPCSGCCARWSPSALSGATPATATFWARGFSSSPTARWSNATSGTVARPHLSALNSSTGQTIHLATYESGEAVYIDKFDAIQSVRMYSRVGRPAPLHCTAVGKVLVAGRPRSEWRQIAERIDYVKFTERTIASAEQYLAELELVAAQDFAEDHEEHESFVNCIGVPVRDGTMAVVAAVSMSVPDMLLDHAQVLATLPQLRAAADAISEELGWSPAA